MRTSNRGPASLALPLACACFFVAAEARATDATEFPDNGSEQGMRGGAWVARASDPLAAFYNPAGLAGQPSRLIAAGQPHLAEDMLHAHQGEERHDARQRRRGRHLPAGLRRRGL